MKRQLISLLFGTVFIIPFFVSAAGMQQASIITRPGVTTSPIKYYFDFSSALSKGVNHTVKVTVSASNSEKTAIRFESVKLFDQSGVAIGNNVASKTDALSSTPYSFVFQNFGVSAEDLKKVAGVQITFLDLGGENPTGKVTVQSVAVSVDRNVGEACIIADPLLVPILPPPTVVSIQTARPLIQPGTHGTGDTSSSGGGGSPASQGPNAPSAASNGLSNSGGTWGSLTNVFASDNLRATADMAQLNTYDLHAQTFAFSIPSSATIDGITANVELNSGTSGATTDYSVHLTKNSAVGSDKARDAGSTWPTSDTVVTFGGSSDLWGTTWTPTEVNNANFGLNIAAARNAPGVTVSIDYISITVNYTTGGGSVYDSFMDLLRVFSKKIF